MASVDNRVVEMKFDNADFERRVATTIQSLDKLQSSLDFAEASKGLSNLEASSKNFQLAGIASALDGITNKFSTLSIIGITVITNLANRAVDAGIAMAKSLSLDQVISGFQEYETNMRSIQTILANTKSEGSTLEDVNSALDELNTYADKTIYNFSEMTRNIGTFTAAGVKLDTSVQSIKGIANLAAISGSNSQQASNAMYQLSQAISTGALKLMDWNSVVNAGMGGRVFQEALFETGKAMGTINGVPIDQTFQQWTDAGNTFRNSLQDGWISAEVLTTTLQGFTGELTQDQLLAIGYTEQQAKKIMELGETGVEAATKVRTLTQLIDTAREAVGSGWSQTFRTVLGDFEDATVLFTGISEGFGRLVEASSARRNDLLDRWVIQGGRDAVIEGLTTAVKSLGSVLTVVKEAFQSIFPPITAYRLAQLSESFKLFTERLVLNDIQLTQLKSILKGVFGLFEIGYTIVKEFFGVFTYLFDVLTADLNTKGIGEFLFNFGNTLSDLNRELVAGGGIKDFFNVIKEFLTVLFTGGENFGNLSAGLVSALQAVNNFFRAFANDPLGALSDLYDRVKEIFGILITGSENLGNLPSGLVDWLTRIREELIDFPSDIFNILFKGDFKGLLGFQEDSKIVDILFDIREGIIEFWDAATERFPLFERLSQRWNGLTDSVESFKDMLQPLKDVVNTVFGYISNWFSELADKMAAAADPGDFSKVLDAVNLGLVGAIGGMLAYLVKGINIDFGGIIEGITDTLDGLTDVLGAMQADIKANAILKIAAAVGILALAALILATVDSVALTKAMTAIAIGLSELMIGFFAITKIGGVRGAASFATAATGLMLLSGAMVLLATAVSIFAKLSWEQIAKGLSAVYVLLMELVVTMQLIQGNTAGILRAGASMILMAFAMNLLASAVALFGLMSWETIGKGLTGITGGLIAMAYALRLMPWNSLSKGAGLILVAVALNILGAAVAIFATMSWEEIGKGIAAIAAGLLLIALAMNLMPLTMPVTAASLLLVSASLLIMAKAMREISSLSWKDLIKAMVGIAGALTILGVAAYFMGNPAVFLGAIAIGILATSVLILATALKTLGSLSWGEIIKSLLVMTAGFLVLGVVAAILGVLSPLIFLFGVALVALGAGMVLVGAGAFLLAAAFKIVSDAGYKGIKTLIDIIDTIISRIPDLAKGLAIGILEIADIILDALPVIIEQLVVILGHLIDGIIELLPKVVELMYQLTDTIIQAIKDKAPAIIQLGFELLIDFLSGLKDNIFEVTNLVLDIILEFIDAVDSRLDEIVDAGFELLTSFLDGIADNIGDVVDSVGDIITTFITSVGDNANKVVTAGVDTVLAFIDGLADNALRLAEGAADVVIDFINGLADAIDEKSGELRDAGWNLAKAVLDGMTFGLAGGVADIAGGAVDLGKSAVSSIGGFLGINSPSKAFIKIGESVVEGFSKGMGETADAENSAVKLAKSASDRFQESLSMMADSLWGLDEFTPTISPVLDLSQVQKDAKQIGSIVGGASLVTPISSYNQANAIATSDTGDQTQDVQPTTTEIRFEQTINAPEALSTADIYRQTRNQITLAKEELNIL